MQSATNQSPTKHLPTPCKHTLRSAAWLTARVCCVVESCWFVEVDELGLIQLSGPTSIVGRAVVVHADPDDLGRGGADDSKTTGHAGARV